MEDEKSKKEEKAKKDKQKKSKKSGHKKLKSSGQLEPATHNFKLESTELPESFFEQMIMTEIDLSENLSMDKIYDLIRLYSEAIEFYLPNDASQVRYFQGRMELLLTKKDTLKLLKKQSQNMDKIDEINNNDNIIGKNSDKNNIILNEIKENKNKNLDKSKLIKEIELRTDNLDFYDISKRVNKVMGDNNINNPQSKKGIDIVTEDLNNIIKKYQRGISLDLMKKDFDGNINNKSEKYKIKEEGDMSKFDKLKKMFNEEIFEEVKEENEGEGSDKENEIKVKDDKLKDLKDNKNKNPDKKKDLEEIEKNIDEKILKSVNERMDLLMKLIGDIENNKLAKDEDEETIRDLAEAFDNALDENDSFMESFWMTAENVILDELEEE